jgi:hypothetical protein
MSAQRPRNVHRIIRATFGEASGQLPSNCRDVSGQLAGNSSQNADECPRQSLHQCWRDGSQMAWQLPPQSTPQSAQHPVNHVGNCRATSEQCPSSWREMSHTTSVDVRTMVGATARKRLGNRRSSPAADHAADRLASTEQSAQCPAWRPGNIR